MIGTLRTLLRKPINALLARAGLRLVHRDWGPKGHVPAVESLIAKGFRPTLVADVGAARGTWTQEFQGIFPAAQFLLVEPLPENEPLLRSLAARHSRLRVWNGVAGPQEGRTPVTSSGDQSSRFSGSEFAGDRIDVPMQRLDSLVDKAARDVFIKIDVQGAELEVLEGATGLLDRCGAILVELTLVPIYEGAPLAGEVIAWLHDHGFALYDITTYAQRPRDGQLSQVDALFVPRGSTLFGQMGWA